MVEQAATATMDTVPAFRTAKPRSLWYDAWRTFIRNKAGVVGLIIVIITLLIAIFAPLIAPYDYVEQDWDHIRESPSSLHWMGTDALGRDLFSRVIMGIRTAVVVGITVTAAIAGHAGWELYLRGQARRRSKVAV